MPKRGSHHLRTGVVRPPRTAFDLSYEKKFTCDFGELIPVMCDEVVPGDFFRLGIQAVMRTQPMFAPLLHEVKISFHTFFAPYRLLWANWELFISGGPNGNYVDTIPVYPMTGMYMDRGGVMRTIPSEKFFGKRSYWDYFGFPLHHAEGNGAHFWPDDEDKLPIGFPYRALNLIWEEFYRDENFQAKCRHASWSDEVPTNRNLGELDYVPNAFQDRPHLPYLRSWTKDYFTAALPFQQRGQQPAFPVSGVLQVQFQGPAGGLFDSASVYFPQSTGPGVGVLGAGPVASPRVPTVLTPSGVSVPDNATATVGPATVDLGDAVSFNVTDLRHIVQLQKWMERNARGGVRYTEFLRVHFAVSPSDERLDRPEYIGGLTTNLVVSEVLQTSANAGDGKGSVIDGTPQGNMSGHGLMAVNGRIGKYFVKEYGLIMTIMSITPTPSYEDGIDRQWLRRINTDFYFPEFVNLSEQAITYNEIYAIGDNSRDLQPWGFEPQYDEMRIKRNMVCSEFRNNSSNNLAFWHLGRHFSGYPNLNQDFIRINPEQFDRCFAVANFQHFICSVGNVIRAIRPLPYIGEPGLVDHH